jgi:FkbM family methyltransferase
MEKIFQQFILKLNEHSSFLQRLITLNKRHEMEINLLKSYLKLNSQFMQDLFVLEQTNFKRNGFFVEFGACDGINQSNTYLLESKFSWNGILSEPGKNWWTTLQKNRNCSIDYRCVWKKSNEVINFNETYSEMLSTISGFGENDMHAEARKDKQTYPVITVSLEDLLRFHNAPQKIDYLSIDTEGSEFEILSNFNFDTYDIQIITIEHNWTPERQKIFTLLEGNGYNRVNTDLTHCDDWYVKQ